MVEETPEYSVREADVPERELVDLEPPPGVEMPVDLSAFVDRWGLVVTGDSYGRVGASEFSCEHWLGVDAGHLDTMCDRLRVRLRLEPRSYQAPWRRRRLLLDTLRQAFAEGVFGSDTDLRDWLDAEGIPNDYGTYTSIDID